MKIKFYYTLVIALLSTGCASQVTLREQYLDAYHMGQIELAEQNLDKAVIQQMPEQYTQSNDAVWLLLDRATIRFSNGNLDGAIEDYRQALAAIDYYNQPSSIEKMAQIALQDDYIAYNGEDFEQILTPVYLSLALMQKQDLSNAMALLRNAETMQQQTKERYSSCPYTSHFELVDNALAKYLLALLCEKKGDISNAKILYEQTAKLIGQSKVDYDLAQLNADESKRNATIVIVCHNGNVPVKVSTTAPASVASAAALEIFLGATGHEPALANLAGIPIPELVESAGSLPLPAQAFLDSQYYSPLRTFYDIGKTAYFQLEQKKPVIVARGVARLAVRRGLVAYVQGENDSIGALVDFGMFIANLKTKADTRSWSTLPTRVDLARFDVEPGTHQLKFVLGNFPKLGPYTVDVKAGGLCVINLFNIHPGNFVVQTPNI